jgi:hypothetical protein
MSVGREGMVTAASYSVGREAQESSRTALQGLSSASNSDHDTWTGEQVECYCKQHSLLSQMLVSKVQEYASPKPEQR